MTRNELSQELLYGRIMLVGQYRGSLAEMAGYVDRKTGGKIQYVRAIHLLELECGGRLDRAIIYERLPEIPSTPRRFLLRVWFQRTSAPVCRRYWRRRDISAVDVYVVECAIGGCFPVIKISGNAPDGAAEPEQVIIPLEKGKRYAFPILTVSKERELATAWIGKGEPLLIEEEEASGGPMVAPQGAAIGAARP